MDWLNTIYGDGFFNKNNLSVHSRRHLYTDDLAIRAILEERAAQEGMDVENTKKNLLTREGAAAAIVAKTFDKMQKGEIDPEVRDALKALEILDKMQESRSSLLVDQMKADFRFFMSAVQQHVPEDIWEAIAETFDELREGRPLQLEASAEIVVGEVTEE